MDRWPRVGPLCLLLAGAAWASSPSLPDPKFESKAALLASRGSEELLCFTQRLEDLVCFWEEAANSGMGFNYSFSYQLEGESRKSCRLHQAPTVRGSVRFWCSLPTADTSSFVPLELQVTEASGSPRYHRIIHINEVVLLDAPAGLLARRAEEGSHVVLRWLPPPGAPMTTHIRYEVDVSAGNRAGGTQRVEVLEGRTECVLSNLRGGTRYTFAVRARMAEPSFSGFWSAWSEPASLLTASGEATVPRGEGGAGPNTRQTSLTFLPPRLGPSHLDAVSHSRPHLTVADCAGPAVPPPGSAAEDLAWHPKPRE